MTHQRLDHVRAMAGLNAISGWLEIEMMTDITWSMRHGHEVTFNLFRAIL